MDIVSAEFKSDPFPLMARLRREEPVVATTLPDKTPVWLVTRYDDVKQLLTDERFAKSPANALTPEELKRQRWVPPMFRPLARNMLDLDPPDHTRLRALVQKAFTPRLIGQMHARVQNLAQRLLDAVAPEGRADLVRDYALPLPVTIIAEILGVPERDRGRFHRWSKAIVAVASPTGGWRAIPSVWQFNRYLRRLIALRRKQRGDDLTSLLIAAEEAGDRLSEDELLSMLFLLLIAGHETTVNLIAGAALELLRHPDQADRLRQEPALAESAVEELLRFTSPVFLSTERYAREDLSLGDIAIPRGALTFGVIGSANRDETVFENSDTLDLARANNKHLGFGLGIHYCLGAPLARLEAKIALTTLFSRMPALRLRLPPESLRWRPSLILRGLHSLPVDF